MLLAIASFSSMAVAGRELWQVMNTFELMLYRSVIGFFIISLVIRFRGGFGQVRTTRPDLHIKRNLWHYTGQNLWFFGVATIPFAQLVSLEFTNPIIVALLAPFMLGETLTRTRLIAAGLGFLGVLIVARPGIVTLELGHAAGLAAALGFAMNTIYTKRLMAYDSVLCVLFWMTLSQGLMSLCLALPGGIPVPGPSDLIWIAVVAICGLTAHLGLTSALAAAPALIVTPMEFARLPVVVLLGMALYDEPFEAIVIVGAMVILAANLVNLGTETRSRRPSDTP